MKNNLKGIIKYLNPYNISGGEPNIKRDWFAVVAFFVFCLLVGAGLGAYVYFDTAKVMTKEIIAPENSVVSVSKAEIKAVVDDIKFKEKKFNDGFIIDALIDPSL
ncbi:MAG: hypothetical protein Q8Q21_00420 [bacterium]|nr:hypothetical protein [bacterium]